MAKRSVPKLPEGIQARCPLCHNIVDVRMTAEGVLHMKAHKYRHGIGRFSSMEPCDGPKGDVRAAVLAWFAFENDRIATAAENRILGMQRDRGKILELRSNIAKHRQELIGLRQAQQQMGPIGDFIRQYIAPPR